MYHSSWCLLFSVEALSLGPMLSQIVVNLLPLLQHLHAQVADIFNFLIVENRYQKNHIAIFYVTC